jgi:hypothetical protein
MAGWPDEPWRSLAESAAVPLLVDSLLQCSLGASVVVIDVTDASMLEAHIFCHWVARETMGIEAAMVSADWVALVSLWEAPTKL